MNIKTIFLRGLKRRCPSCGEDKLFQKYITPSSTPCKSCGLNFETIRSDDIPAYFTIFIVGHIILPLVLLVEKVHPLSMTFHFLLWLPLTILMVFWLLPYMKGVAMAVLWWSKQQK